MCFLFSPLFSLSLSVYVCVYVCVCVTVYAFVRLSLYVSLYVSFNVSMCHISHVHFPEQVDGTPIICTPNTPNLFYRNRNVNNRDPAGDLAQRIRTAAAQYEPPYFITIYGGLSWYVFQTHDSLFHNHSYTLTTYRTVGMVAGREPGTAHGNLEFWTLLHGIMKDLGDDFVAIGATELARLARDACNRTGYPPAPPPGPPTCGVTARQNDCSPTPGKPWRNSSQPACEQLGCCWHLGGIAPSGHTCIQKEQSAAPAPTCLKKKQQQ